MLTPQQIEDYRNNGFLLIENALTEQQLTRLRTVTNSLIQQSATVTQSNEMFDLDAGHSADNPRLTRIKLPHTLDPIYWEIIRSDNIRGLITPLIGDNIRLHTSKLNTKAPDGGMAVEWHQDWAFYPHTNDDLLAVGIMLEDVTEQSGPLMAVPGTHKGPILDHSRNGVFCGAIDPEDPLFEADKAKTLTGSAGSLSIHHVRTLHGSAPNHSNNARKILFYECIAADAWPISGGVSGYNGLSQQQMWEGMNSRLVCGEQSRTARVENVPVRMPLAPPPDPTSIFKVQKSGGAVSAFNRS